MRETLAVLIDVPAPDRRGNASGQEEILVLLATILGAGRVSASSLAASHRILRRLGATPDLGRAGAEELRRAGRISPRRAQVLHAALQLGLLAGSNPLARGERFSNSRELFLRYRSLFSPAAKEYFFSLHLNSKNQLIREMLVSIGSLSTSVVHPREVFAPAVRDSAASIILLHNHPSGDPAPSREDRECTQRLAQAGRLLGIRVLDHVIFGQEDYFSFADAALLADHAPPL